MIQLNGGQFGWDHEIINLETGESLFIQTDWEYPGFARDFGWIPKPGKNGCKHPATDGTVICPDCGRTPTEFITEAGDFLTENEGATAADPGYWD